MLAIEIRRSKQNYLTRPRPLRMDAPLLSMESRHAGHVALGWPVAMLHSKLRLTSTCLQKSVIEEVVARVQRHFAPAWLVERLWASIARSTMTGRINHRMKQEGPATLWRVLPYHPFMCRALVHQAVEDMIQHPWMHGAWSSAFSGKPPRIRISWRNSLPTHAAIVQKFAS